MKWWIKFTHVRRRFSHKEIKLHTYAYDTFKYSYTQRIHTVCYVKDVTRYDCDFQQYAVNTRLWNILCHFHVFDLNLHGSFFSYPLMFMVYIESSTQSPVTYITWIWIKCNIVFHHIDCIFLPSKKILTLTYSCKKLTTIIRINRIWLTHLELKERKFSPT